MTAIHIWLPVFVASALLLPAALPTSAAGDPEKGALRYRVCAGCHSLEPGRQSAGPSLAGIFGRKAGTVAGYTRYSEALRRSNVVWDEETLDAWIKKSDSVVPGNLMPFPGIADPDARADLVAFLKNVSAKSGNASGWRGSSDQPSLKALPAENASNVDTIDSPLR